jgi:hypothetical protein
MQDNERDESTRRQFSRLPQEIMPGRDLWPQIRAQIEPEAKIPRGASWSGHSMRWALAASIAGFAIGILVTRAVVRERSAVMPSQRATVGLVPASVYAFAPPKAEAVRLDLRREAAATLSHLPPPTRARVQRNLMEIERALADIQVALKQNPNDALLQELLMTTYQNEVDTLSNVVMLARDANVQVSL